MKSITPKARTMMTASLLFAAVMLMASLPSAAQAKDCKLRIAGRVYMSSNSGPVGIRREQVHLLNQEGNLITTVRTDLDGYYSFRSLCPGTYTVRPGPLWLANVEGPRLPALYTPSNTTVRLPERIGDATSSLHVDFRKVEPPPGRQPEAEKGEETIRVDEATRAGRDLEIANQVKSFLEGRVPCKAPRTCSLTIKVTNGRVELAGIIHPDYRSELGRIKANVRGVASVSLVGVKVSSSK